MPMRASEAIESFLVYYDRIYSMSAKGYTDEEILLFISDAMRETVDTLALQKKLDLCPIVTQTLNFTPVAPLNTRLYEAYIGNPIRRLLAVSFNVSRTAYPQMSNFIIDGVEANKEMLYRISSLSNVVLFDNVLYAQEAGKVFAAGDSFTIINSAQMRAVPVINNLVYIPGTRDDYFPVADILIESIIKRAVELAKISSDPIRVRQLNAEPSNADKS